MDVARQECAGACSNPNLGLNMHWYRRTWETNGEQHNLANHAIAIVAAL